MRKILLVFPLFLLAGCAGVFGKPSPVQEVGEFDMVKDCELLTTFAEPAGYWTMGAPYTGCYKYSAMQQAEKIGATHVLWRTDLEGIQSTGILFAYKCPPDHDARREMEKERQEEY
jgi:hypothetical protein